MEAAAPSQAKQQRAPTPNPSGHGTGAHLYADDVIAARSVQARRGAASNAGKEEKGSEVKPHLPGRCAGMGYAHCSVAGTIKAPAQELQSCNPPSNGVPMCGL